MQGCMPAYGRKKIFKFSQNFPKFSNLLKNYELAGKKCSYTGYSHLFLACPERLSKVLELLDIVQTRARPTYNYLGIGIIYINKL
jgi:hypothetical protein